MGQSASFGCTSGEKSSKAQLKEERYSKSKPEEAAETNGEVKQNGDTAPEPTEEQTADQTEQPVVEGGVEEKPAEDKEIEENPAEEETPASEPTEQAEAAAPEAPTSSEDQVELKIEEPVAKEAEEPKAEEPKEPEQAEVEDSPGEKKDEETVKTETED